MTYSKSSRAVTTAARPRLPASVPAGGRFHRGLLFFSVVFSLLLLADVVTIGNLVFRDLSRQVVGEAKVRARAAAENVARGLAPVSDGLLRLVQTRLVFTRYVDHELQRATVIDRMDLVTAQGELVATRARRADVERRPHGPGEFPPLTALPPGGETRELPGAPPGSGSVPEVPGAPFPSLPPGDRDDAGRHPRQAGTFPLLDPWHIPGPTLELDPRGPGDFDRFTHSRRDIVIPVRLPSGQPGQIQVALSTTELDRELDQIRHDLLIKIFIGAGISVLLIIVAYLFVVKLFQKTRRLEAEAQMADRLAYVGTLAAGLAHEIRNPLSAMNLNLQLLEMGIDTPGDPGAGPGPEKEKDAEARELLGETRAEVDRLGQLVTSFLSYARPPRLERKPSDLNRIMEETGHFLQADARARGVDIEVHPGEGLPVLPLDPTQVRQAILNIVKNAISALESTGAGTIHLSTGQNPSGEVHLLIEDDGPGIPQERLQDIFQVFYSGRPGGSGLGLPIARRVMEGHGGRIDVESTVGSGTRFSLVFPVPGHRAGMKAAL
ncbi:MAG: nitrogen regulation protein NR(II) [Acidobacteriota bacterium]